MSIHDEIVQLATVLCPDGEELLAKICGAVEQNLMSRLRSGVSIDDCRDSFIYASALMSVSVIKTVDADQLSGFDAGTLKLSFHDRTNQISALANQLMAPWLASTDFAFRGVGE